MLSEGVISSNDEVDCNTVTYFWYYIDTLGTW